MAEATKIERKVPAHWAFFDLDRFWVSDHVSECQVRLERPTGQGDICDVVYLSHNKRYDPTRTLKSVSVSWEVFSNAFSKMIEELEKSQK